MVACSVRAKDGTIRDWKEQSTFCKKLDARRAAARIQFEERMGGDGWRVHTEGESLSAEDIALPTATEGREPGLASMGTIWTWRRWTSSLPTLLPSLRGWMVDAQQYHVPRGVCKKSIIPAAHRVHSDQSLSSLEDVWHTQGAGI